MKNAKKLLNLINTDSLQKVKENRKTKCPECESIKVAYEPTGDMTPDKMIRFRCQNCGYEEFL